MKKSLLFLPCIAIAVISYCQTDESKMFYQKAIVEINPKHVKWIKSKAADADVTDQGISNLQVAARNYLSASKISAVDPNALVQLVLREAYLQTTEDLKFYAEKVKYFNTTKKLVRDHTQKLRDYDTKMKESLSRSKYDSIKSFNASIQTDLTPPSNPNFNRTVVKKDVQRVQPISRPIDQTMVARPVSADEVRMLIKELEQKEDSLNELGEEVSLKMQMLMERMQKAETMASNLFKKFADTSNSIISNLK